MDLEIGFCWFLEHFIPHFFSLTEVKTVQVFMCGIHIELKLGHGYSMRPPCAADVSMEVCLKMADSPKLCHSNVTDDSKLDVFRDSLFSSTHSC